MNHSNRFKTQQSKYQSRWKVSINQLSRMEEQSKMVKLDSMNKKICCLKLKMKNRLGQIDQEWEPIVERKIMNSENSKIIQKHQNNRMASTAHDTNIFTSLGTQQHKLQQSIILPSTQPNPQHTQQPYTCHPIRQQLIQELTSYNKQKYDKQMKQQCSKYSQSVKSIFYQLVNNEKKQIDQFCYLCDEILKDSKQRIHQCKGELNSIVKVNNALERLRLYIDQKNNKIFHVFFHNTLQPSINIDELISNITVLKQSIHLNYDPEEVILRLRLMNLMGKKLSLLLEEKDLQQRLLSICQSKK